MWRKFLVQLSHFFALMLWVAGFLAIIAGMPQLGIAIFVVVLVNGVFAFAQERSITTCRESSVSAFRHLVVERITSMEYHME